MIKIRAINNAMVVMLSAKELPTGITKLSGSKPLLNVSMEMANIKIVMALKAITLETESISNKLMIPCNENIPFKVRDKRPRTANRTRDATQALNMFLA
jgi:hypothetical protein